MEELKSEGNVDLEGGYVTATGIHYVDRGSCGGAKEAEEALYDGHGPSASSAPGARLPPSNDGAGKIDRLYDDITTETHRNNSKTIEKEGRRSDNADREVDLEAIRNKLKRKKPSFFKYTHTSTKNTTRCRLSYKTTKLQIQATLERNQERARYTSSLLVTLTHTLRL